MNESTPAWQLDDETWVRLYPDEGDVRATTGTEVDATLTRRNYATFSFDNGKTLTPARRTSFPDSCAHSNAGKLPDSQVYVNNNTLSYSLQTGRSLDAGDLVVSRRLEIRPLSRDSLPEPAAAIPRKIQVEEISATAFGRRCRASVA